MTAQRGIMRMAIGRRAVILGTPLFGLSRAHCAAAAEQDFPNRTVRIVQGFTAGGPTDLLARLLAEQLHVTWGVAVIADARPGAGGTIAAAQVARAAPEGHTLLVIPTTHVQSPLLMPGVSYDPIRDFTPIVQLTYYPFVLVVRPDLPAQTLGEFLALARTGPGAVTDATTGAGSSPHLAAASLGIAAGVEFTHVPFSGTAQGLTALLAGQVDAAFLNPFLALQYIQGGRLRALAVTSAARWRDLPDVPTLAEAGYPGNESVSWFGVAGPAGMSPALAARLHDDIQAAGRVPHVRERLAAAGFAPMEAGPDAFRVIMEQESAKCSALIQKLGLKPD